MDAAGLQNDGFEARFDVRQRMYIHADAEGRSLSRAERTA